jgi:hypothetical protein
MGDTGPVAGLRRLRRRELVRGTPLPGHVRDRSGRILIRKGQRLSDQHLELIIDREAWDVYADADWPPPGRSGQGDLWVPTPAELLEALKRRRPPRGESNRVRRHTRYQWRGQLRLMLQVTGTSQRQEVVVTTCDLSSQGFSFICDRFVYPDTVVYPHFDSLPSRPVMKGVVRNCVHLEGRQHRVGVQFVNLEPGEILPRE